MTLKEIRKNLIGKTIRIETKTEHSKICQRLTVKTINAIPHDKENLVANRGLHSEWTTDRNMLEGLAQGWEGEDVNYDGGKSTIFYVEEGGGI